MGEGVRELDEALEGEGDIDPSSDPRIVSSTASGSSTPSPDFRVRALGTLPSVPVRRGGRPVVGATRCFGASGGLFAAGWNSMMGRRRFSQLYCFASCRPRSSGIHVPGREMNKKRMWILVGTLSHWAHLGISHSRLGLSRVHLSVFHVRGPGYAGACRSQRLLESAWR